MFDDLTKLPPELMPTIEELPGDLRRIAEIIDEVAPGCGVLAGLRLEAEYRGTAAYFHNMDEWRRKLRNNWIRRRYDQGGRPNDIAREANLAIRQFWNIVGCEPVDDRQLKLF